MKYKSTDDARRSLVRRAETSAGLLGNTLAEQEYWRRRAELARRLVDCGDQLLEFELDVQQLTVCLVVAVDCSLDMLKAQRRVANAQREDDAARRGIGLSPRPEPWDRTGPAVRAALRSRKSAGKQPILRAALSYFLPQLTGLGIYARPTDEALAFVFTVLLGLPEDKPVTADDVRKAYRSLIG